MNGTMNTTDWRLIIDRATRAAAFLAAGVIILAAFTLLADAIRNSGHVSGAEGGGRVESVPLPGKRIPRSHASWPPDKNQDKESRAGDRR